MAEIELNEDIAKYLTKKMDLCWHENIYLHEVVSGPHFNIHYEERCGKCKNRNVRNRTFKTWNDLGDLWEWMSKRDDWFIFTDWVTDKYINFDPNFVMGPLRYLVNPSNFALLVYEYLKKLDNE